MNQSGRRTDVPTLVPKRNLKQAGRAHLELVTFLHALGVLVGRPPCRKRSAKGGEGWGIKALLTATIAIVSSALLTGCDLSTQSLESEPHRREPKLPG